MSLFKSTYIVVENPYEETAGIQLVEGEWKGLVYQYGDVQFVDGKPELNFKRTNECSKEIVPAANRACLGQRG